MSLPEVVRVPELMNVERLYCLSDSQTELVLVHGWGSDRTVWRSAVPYLRRWAHLTLIDLPGCGKAPAGSYDLDAILEDLAVTVPCGVVIVGWSLGGMIATAFAERYPERVLALGTVACNAAFLSSEQWPSAMSTARFVSFQQKAGENSSKGLAYFDRLQCGTGAAARSNRALLAGVREHEAEAETLLASLHLLAGLDNRYALSSLSIPALHLFGAEDLLVPLAAAEAIAHLAPSHCTKIHPAGAHLLPLSDPGWVSDQIKELCEDVPELAVETRDGSLDKSRIAESFSRAAGSYDQYAEFQADVSRALFNRSELLESNGQAESILDLGCGTAQLQPNLTGAFPGAHYIGLDIAEGMLRRARDSNPVAGGLKSQWVCADAENLPLDANSMDFVFSSLAIQWCQNPDGLFSELHRVMRAGAWCCFATLGPGTLDELRLAWAEVDEHTHVNEFVPLEDLSAAIQKAGLQAMQLHVEPWVMRYPDLRDLTSSLKGIGAHNINEGRPAGLTGRAAIRGFREAYENQRVDGLLPATYHVIFGVLYKPECRP